MHRWGQKLAVIGCCIVVFHVGGQRPSSAMAGRALESVPRTPRLCGGNEKKKESDRLTWEGQNVTVSEGTAFLEGILGLLGERADDYLVERAVRQWRAGTSDLVISSRRSRGVRFVLSAWRERDRGGEEDVCVLAKLEIDWSLAEPGDVPAQEMRLMVAAHAAKREEFRKLARTYDSADCPARREVCGPWAKAWAHWAEQFRPQEYRWLLLAWEEGCYVGMEPDISDLPPRSYEDGDELILWFGEEWLLEGVSFLRDPDTRQCDPGSVVELPH